MALLPNVSHPLRHFFDICYNAAKSCRFSARLSSARHIVTKLLGQDHTTRLTLAKQYREKTHAFSRSAQRTCFIYLAALYRLRLPHRVILPLVFQEKLYNAHYLSPVSAQVLAYFLSEQKRSNTDTIISRISNVWCPLADDCGDLQHGNGD